MGSSRNLRLEQHEPLDMTTLTAITSCVRSSVCWPHVHFLEKSFLNQADHALDEGYAPDSPPASARGALIGLHAHFARTCGRRSASAVCPPGGSGRRPSVAASRRLPHTPGRQPPTSRKAQPQTALLRFFGSVQMPIAGPWQHMSTSSSN